MHFFPSNGSISTNIQQGIAYVTFEHPQANSFPKLLLTELSNQLHILSENSEVKLIVLQSKGESVFCAGASFNELLQIQTPEQGFAFFSGFATLLNAMRICKKLIIGRTQGKAVGGGVGILSGCDYVFATENSLVKLSEISIGIGPFVIAPALERKIGIGAFSELTLDPNTWRSAQWAKEKGLYNEVFPNTEIMDTHLASFAENLAQTNLNALLNLKQLFWKNTENWENILFENAKISGELILSEYSKNILKHIKK